MVGRVTNTQLNNQRVGWIEQARVRLAAAEETISTGRVINRPSDDPTGSAEVLRHQRRLERVEQLDRNAANARMWSNTADQALQASNTDLTRAKTLAIQGANDSLTPEARSAIAAELRSIAEELISNANTTVSGRPLFAGTADVAAAFDATGAYLGDTGTVRRSIESDQVVEVARGGTAAFGVSNPGDPMNGNVFEMIRSVADAVEAGTIADVRTGIDQIDGAAARMAGELGRVGAVSQQIDAVVDRHESEKLNVNARVSLLRDADLAESIIKLQSAEASYQATLSSTAKALSRSLLDFLR